jgi:hypothetical protein
MATQDRTCTPGATADDRLVALGALLSQLESDVDCLAELLRDSEPSATAVCAVSALKVMAWQLDFGRRLAGHTGTPLVTEQERFLPAGVLRHVEAGA